MSLIESFSFLGKFWQEKINGSLIKWTIFIIILQLVLIFYKFSVLPSEIPLFYSLPWGESRLVNCSYIFILPGFSIFFTMINNILAVSYYASINVLSRLLTIFSLIFSLFSLIALIQIIILVT
jgi:hypothetical protein